MVVRGAVEAIWKERAYNDVVNQFQNLVYGMIITDKCKNKFYFHFYEKK